MRENRLQRNIRKALEALPHTYVLPIQSGPYIRKGEPDLIGCHRGRSFALETKTPHGKDPTDIQIHRLKGWYAAGARVGVARSVGEALSIVWGHVSSPYGLSTRICLTV
jgi:hypothetical protein